jgi:quinol monooxygenase YgiN
MSGTQAVLVGISLIAASLISSGLISTQRGVADDSARDPIVRIAELEIVPGQLDAYKIELKAEIETSIRVEPGVLMLYAVSVKEHPEQIRLFETYRDQAAYESHLQSAHFKTYKDRTREMVKSLRLVETEPILLGSKSK